MSIQEDCVIQAALKDTLMIFTKFTYFWAKGFGGWLEAKHKWGAQEICQDSNDQQDIVSSTLKVASPEHTANVRDHRSAWTSILSQVPLEDDDRLIMCIFLPMYLSQEYEYVEFFYVSVTLRKE